MKVSHLFAAFVLIMFMGCGGGGGGQAPEQSASSNSPPKKLHTVDLLAPDDFKYQSSRNVHFVVETLSLENRRAFVSIFSQYQLVDSIGWQPDFSSRILLQELIDGRLDVNLKIDNNINRVLIEIWTDRAEEQPYILESAIDNGELAWLI